MHKCKNEVIKGFTLIELLVVVAIVTVLAAILFPVFARARENARRASCMSNLKQLGLAMQMYSQDYDEQLVPYYLGTMPVGSDPYYPWRLLPYTKNGQVFKCPSQQLDQTRYWSEATYSAYSPLHINYGYNWFWLGEAALDIGVYMNNYRSIPLSAIQNTAQAALFVESSSLGWHGTYTGDTTEAGPITYYNHFEGANVCFVDGHVKWLKKVPVQPLGYQTTAQKFGDPIKAMFHMGRTE